VLTGVIGFKEPWSNLDNFVARLRATCTEFEQKSQHTVNVFTSAGHRDSPHELDAFDWKVNGDLLCPPYYYAGPMGGNTGMVGAVEIGTNPGKDYVQNLRFFARCAKLNTDNTITWLMIGDSNQMIHDNGYEMFDRSKLSCPSDDYVVTGIAVRFELGKGKIRELRMLCRQLRYTP
jgi:hypothetical protein